MVRQRHHAFVVVISPSKAATQPEGIPTFRCANGEGKGRVAPRLVEALLQSGAPTIDGRSLTKRLEQTSAAPIFPTYGIHWNAWGAHPTVAELLRMTAEQLGDAAVRLEASDPVIVQEPVERSRERAARLNLYRGPRDTIPIVRFKLDTVPPLRRATIVGDSFAEAMIEVLEKARAYSSIERFNYLTEFHESHPGGHRKENFRVDDIDWGRDVFESDVLILEINEMVELPDFAKVFVREALRRIESRPVE
jgi:hypothetical protein